MFEYTIFIKSIINTSYLMGWICACAITSLNGFKSEVMSMQRPACLITILDDYNWDNDFIILYLFKGRVIKTIIEQQ